MQQLFESIIDSGAVSAVSPGKFLACVAVSLAAGLILAKMSMWRVESSKSFMITLAVLPAAVCAVIMMVNGNLGAGVAVAGAFSLVRFRSASGTAREIAALFCGMGVGLMTGMGCIGYAVLFALIVGAVMMIYTALNFGEGKAASPSRELYITIPEDLDYNGVFEPIMEQYTESYRLVQVKTIHLGSLFRLKYEFKLKDSASEKAFIDELRVRNGNLEIMLSFREPEKPSEL